MIRRHKENTAANRSPKIPVCIFAKPARPGEVKTRLIPLIGSDGAALLARAFFEDVWAMVSCLHWANPIVASTEAMQFNDARTVWLQGDGDLGEKMANVLRSALREHARAFVIGADLPGLPPDILRQAHAALNDHDAVLGPSDDGGFYLLGLKRCPEGLLSGVRWSDSDTFLQTFTRLTKATMKVAVIQRWFDVDTPKDLMRLRSLLETVAVTAPSTKSALESLGMLHAPQADTFVRM